MRWWWQFLSSGGGARSSSMATIRAKCCANAGEGSRIETAEQLHLQCNVLVNNLLVARAHSTEFRGWAQIPFKHKAFKMQFYAAPLGTKLIFHKNKTIRRR